MYEFKRDVLLNVLNVQTATYTTVWFCYIPHRYALLRRIVLSSVVCRSVSRCQCVTL